MTRPYRTLNGDRLSITASVAFMCKVDGREVWHVICGDVVWDDRGQGLAGQYAAQQQAIQPGGPLTVAASPLVKAATAGQPVMTTAWPPTALLR